MTGALAMHDNLLRELLHHHCGYEVSPYLYACVLHSLLCMRFPNLLELLYEVML